MLIALIIMLLLFIILANYADVRRSLRPAIQVILGLVDLLVGGGGLTILLMGAILLLRDPGWAAPVLTGGGVLLATGLTAALMLVPAVRVKVGLAVDIDPESTVHTTALTLLIHSFGFGVLQIILWEEISQSLPPSIALSFVDLAANSSLMLLAAFAGVGTLVRRTATEALARLGLHRPQWRHLLVVVGLIVLFLLLDATVAWLWEMLAPGSFESSQRTSDLLFGSLLTPLGALAVGLSAGIGEEILFRGALQPRFGILITSLLFMLAHFQYAFLPGMLEVLVIGIALGYLRRKIGTLPCILVHAGYNLANMLIFMAIGD
jgi:membrane protease YdiL (CAAX protease family)